MMSEAQTLKGEEVMYNIMAQKRVTNEWDLNDLLKKLDRLNEENAPSDNKEKSDDDADICGCYGKRNIYRSFRPDSRSRFCNVRRRCRRKG